MTPTERTYDQLRDDLDHLEKFIKMNRAPLADRGILTPILAMTSRAEAKLDAHVLLPLPGRGRLDNAHRIMTRAWLRINAKAITGQEIGSQRS